MEPESREGTGASRSLNVVHLLAREPVRVASLLAGALERARAGEDGVRALIVVPSEDDALALAGALQQHAGSAGAGTILPVTSTRRARRVLAGPAVPTALIATPAQLTALLEQSVTKLATLRLLCLVWLDELLGEGGVPALEALLAEVPRDAERIVFATALDADAETFLERFLWRARRVSHPVAAASANVPVRYVVSTGAARGEALRMVLDALDPDSAVVVTYDEASTVEASRAIALLGFGSDPVTVRLSRGIPEADPGAGLAIFYDEPPDAHALDAMSSGGRPVIVFVAPSRLARLRALGGDDCAPLASARAFQAARTAADLLRDELRTVARSGVAQAQLATIEPLCGDLDPAEVAAAALYLLLRERRRLRVAEAASAAVPAPADARPAAPSAAAGMTRLYVNIGERDGARPSDLVGAITGESGITGTQIGRIDLHESHAIVEIESAVAERVVQRMSGSTIRGRRVIVREDQGRERAPRGPSREGGGRRGPAGARRGAGRAPEAATDERIPRLERESREWSERAERLRQSRRPAREEP